MPTKLLRFKMGRIVSTPGALAALESNGQNPLEFIAKHAACNWGDALPEDDKLMNDMALEDGSRIMSSYYLKDRSKLWIITEAAMDDEGNRSATTLLLPDEY